MENAKIQENMLWPPMNFISWKMAEHSAWYSGSSEVLANFYSNYMNAHLPAKALREMSNDSSFWGRQLQNQGEVFLHVPLAGDIAETSASLLFSEEPTIRIAEANVENASTNAKNTQQALLDALDDRTVQMFNKIYESAEACSGIGGVYIKLAWDEEISKYPIPVVEQADYAIPEFKFGVLNAVTFWKVMRIEKDGSKTYRLLERYSKGLIEYTLYLGTSDRLGYAVPLESIEETEDLKDFIDLNVDALLAVYIPNIRPNRVDRGSNYGRSDYCGQEGLMDALDETYSSWMKDIALAQAKVMIPEEFLQKTEKGFRYNLDQMLYTKLDMDPTIEGNKITPQQFAIRSVEFEQTSVNLMERIISGAGYSPQSFGLRIEGRSESGLALHIRERKSFVTKGKKERYWKPAIQRLLELFMLVYRFELRGNEVDPNLSPTVEFNDGVLNDRNETANSLKLLADAQAISVETRVRILHPDWEEEQILAEAERIKEENMIGQMVDPTSLNADDYDDEGDDTDGDDDEGDE